MVQIKWWLFAAIITLMVTAAVMNNLIAFYLCVLSFIVLGFNVLYEHNTQE